MRQIINQMSMKFDSRSINEGFARMSVAVLFHSLILHWKSLMT